MSRRLLKFSGGSVDDCVAFSTFHGESELRIASATSPNYSS
jgi:hypothetical protein